MSSRFAGRRFSWLRLTILLVVVGALGYSAFVGVRWVQDTAEVDSEAAPWFAGYVDITATPSYAVETETSDGTENVTLAFVVSNGACSPSWGGAYSLTEAAASLDLDRRIARMRDQDRDVIVSFGGQANDELALDCDSASELEDAYRAVVERYDLTTIDFDIEGTALADTASGELRAEAVAALQQSRRDAGDQLAVWLTLPVSPDGLTADGSATVARFLAAGVDLAGVNAMTMNFGESRSSSESMSDASIRALQSTHDQLAGLYRSAGIQLGDRSLWRKIGATPMIGQNDVSTDIFTLADAKALNAFGIETELGRMSMWSLNRDKTCSVNYGDTTRVSDACSGVDQGDTTYAELLADGFDASPDASAVATTAEPVESGSDEDDPETSPYPIWNESASYPAGTKIVWHRNVYEAKWWTQGDLPDDPVAEESSTPWRYIGPVLDGETPIAVPTLPEGFYPTWDPEAIYEAGDRILYEGIAYQARWWNQTASPEVALASPGDSPWERLSDDEVTRLLADADSADG
ncbi:chitinase [Homoserinibacter sp. GY 40078]|uniref:chitinase n=1 Tax=Homoserinibacter sp. GY 40078 TaxID=2603275 RepID=UPI0011CB4EED|nr:carbohydrate-binding protein [Homoserinibacter sp. GY 40078]TXK17063.1 glycosyl hydrolase family 18 [Homoserinibacter sp. GY 40078]